MPDFDQMQVGPTYCGPFAAANSLWWFDSKFEQHPVGPSGGPLSTIPISDSYTLVKSYDPSQWDDHDPRNVISLTANLGKYFKTDKIGPGTYIYDMYYGFQRYLRDHGLWDDYIVTLVNKPEFTWIADEVMRSEDVILLLGFWQQQEFPPGSGTLIWVRIGGHYVTVAGVDKSNPQIAFSDPAQDWAEAGGAGRVLSGTLLTHYPPHPGPGPTVHNDAGNVSHDIYAVLPDSPSPGGSWRISEYEPPSELLTILGLNPNPKWTKPPMPRDPDPSLPVHAEIEYALAVSPYTWKASGQWVEDQNVALYYKRFDPYQDFAPSGVPDFDQKQDNWVDPTGTGGWSFCGPVAAADSLWWFDSKFEDHGATPPVISDTYPLVRPYGAWDDHDPQNVVSLTVYLARYFRTDVVGSGTVITDLYAGLISYTVDHDLRQGYVLTQVQSPDFGWVAEEVERSEDVILLLGFYVSPAAGIYERVGGHFVTVPGVDKQGGLVGFSDPFWDRMESVLPSNEFVKLPLWTGRVGSDGDPPLGASGLAPTYTHIITHTGVYTLHNDAANISHDVYYVTPTNSPGGIWGPQNYVQDTSQIVNFAGMNGGGVYPGSGRPVQTEVEWAVAMSPVADVWITKTVTPALVTPGEWVTFTLTFGNAGNTAEGVVISDALDSRLINASYTYMLNYTGTLTGYDTFTWTVGTLHWNEGGIITITAQVNASLGWPSETALTNTAAITTTTQEQYQVKQMPDSTSASFKVQTADLGITKVASPASPASALATLYDQTDNPTTFTISSQAYGYPYQRFDSQAADDFVVPIINTGAWSISTVEVVGAYNIPGIHVDSVSVQVYGAAGGMMPEVLVYSTTVVPTSDIGGDLVINLDPPVIVAPDAYWLSVQANMNYSPGQKLWLWRERTVQSNTASIWQNPPDGYGTGCITWAPRLATCHIGFYPDLLFKLSGAIMPEKPAVAVPGDPVTFTVVFSNAGSGLAEEVVLSDALPSGLSNIGTSIWLSNDGSYTFHPGAVYVWDLPDLAQGDWGMITVTANISPSLAWPASTLLTNAVTITTSTVEPVPGLPNTASADLTVQTADLGIRKTTSSIGPLFDSDWLTFTLVYLNAGPAPATSVVITDLLSTNLLTSTASFTYTNSYGGLLVANDHYVWQAGQVPARGWGIITVTAQVSNAQGSSLANQALIGGWFDRDPANNQATITVPLPAADVWVAKTVTPRLVTPGDWLTFAIAFGNASYVADSIVISDVLPSGLTNASYTYTLNYSGTLVGSNAFTWTVGTLRKMDGGVVTVTAQVDPTASWPATLMLTNTVEITTTTAEQTQRGPRPDAASAGFTIQTADLGIRKTVSPTGTLTTGDWLTFTLVYSNAGPAPATSVVITDVLSSKLVTSTATFTYTTSYLGVLTASDHLAWQAGAVPAGSWGIITVTAQLSNAQGSSLANQALINGWFDRDPSNNQMTIAVPLSGSTIYLPVTMKQ